MATSYDVNDEESSEPTCFSRFLTSLETKATGLGRFLYSDGKVIGRTGKSWAKIGLFYLIYYSCLAGFFAMTLAVFYTTTEWETPKLQGQASLLKDNPGLGFRPLPTKLSSTLIKFSIKKEDTWKVHSDLLDTFLEKYKTENQTESHGFVTCSEKGLRNKDDWDKMCRFDPANDFGKDNKCTNKDHYGYSTGKPCVLLKLNKVFGWIPKAYNNDSSEEKERIPSSYMGSEYSKDHVNIQCYGTYDGDKDNIGMVEFYPKEGFPFAYYPYLNQGGNLRYLQPLVFARFTNIVPGVVVMVNCEAYAQNIERSKRGLKGSIHFEILVD